MNISKYIFLLCFIFSNIFAGIGMSTHSGDSSSSNKVSVEKMLENGKKELLSKIISQIESDSIHNKIEKVKEELADNDPIRKKIINILNVFEKFKNENIDIKNIDSGALGNICLILDKHDQLDLNDSDESLKYIENIESNLAEFYDDQLTIKEYCIKYKREAILAALSTSLALISALLCIIK